MNSLLSLMGIELNFSRETIREENIICNELFLLKEFQIPSSKSLIDVCSMNEDFLIVMISSLSKNFYAAYASQKISLNIKEKRKIKWYIGDLGNIYLFTKCTTFPSLLLMKGKEVKGTWSPEMNLSFDEFMMKSSDPKISEPPPSSSPSSSFVSLLLNEQNDAYSRSLAIDRAKREEKERRREEEEEKERQKNEEISSYTKSIESLIDSTIGKISLQGDVCNVGMEKSFVLSIHFPSLKENSSLKVENVTNETFISTIYYKAFHHYLKNQIFTDPSLMQLKVPDINDFYLSIPSYPPHPIPFIEDVKVSFRCNTRLIFQKI